MKRFVLAMMLMLVGTGCGVDKNSIYMSPPRQANGLVVILPGIEGESPFNHDIRKGLQAAGCYRAMPIYKWGTPIPLIGMFVNQTNVLGNRAIAKKIARWIEDYQDNHPGRPVHVIGHSGGGGIAVFVAESMSQGRQIDGLILLSASISGNYNLSKALSNCKSGIVNFYNKGDALLASTVFVGNVDGGRYTSAGLGGFSQKYSRLYQIQVTSAMTRFTGGGAHDAATRPGFVSHYVAPWVIASHWPVDLSLMSGPHECFDQPSAAKVAPKAKPAKKTAAKKKPAAAKPAAKPKKPAKPAKTGKTPAAKPGTPSKPAAKPAKPARKPAEPAKKVAEPKKSQPEKTQGANGQEPGIPFP